MMELAAGVARNRLVTKGREAAIEGVQESA